MGKDLSLLKNSVKIGEAAKILGVSIDTLRRWEKAGKIETVRTPGGTRLYPISELERVKNNSSYSDQPTDPIASFSPNTTSPDWHHYLNSQTPSSAPIIINESREHISDQPVTPVSTPKSSRVSKLSFTTLLASLLIFVASFMFFSGKVLNLYQTRTGLPTEPGIVSNELSNVLAAANVGNLLQVNGNTEIKGEITAEKFNGLTLQPLGIGFSIASGSANLTVSGSVATITGGSTLNISDGSSLIQTGASTLQITNSATIDQDISTISSPTFSNLTVTNVLNLGRLSADPATAVNGAVYYNTTNNEFRCYQNGAWKNCDTDTTGTSFAGITLAGSSGTSQTISDGDTITIGAGSGVTTTAGSTDTVTIALDTTTTGTTATTSSNSGLEVSSDGIRLLGGCANGEVLTWDSVASVWKCATATSGLSGSGTANTIAKWSGASALTNSGIGDDGTTITLGETTLNISSGTASRFPVLDASKNVVYSALSSILSNTLSDETGTGGVAVFSSSPSIDTSLDSASSSFALLASPTTINFGTAATTANLINGNTATTINLGSGSGGNTINIAGTGATGADTINIGTGGTGADTITLGSNASTTSLALKAGSGGTNITNATTTATTFISSTANSDRIAIKPQSTGTGGTFTGTISTADLSANTIYLFPDNSSNPTDTVCLQTLANCTGAGGGSGVTYTAQTTNAITKFTGTAGQITSSNVTDDGTTITLTGIVNTTLPTTSPATFSSSTANSDSIAIKPQSTGTGAGFTATITTADLTGGAQTFRFPDLTAATSDTVCLLTLANCFGSGGGGVTYTSQSTNALTKFTGVAGQITSSGVTDDGTTITLGETTLNIGSGTASRFALLDGSKNVVYSGLSSVLLNTLSDETGTGVAVFGTSPTITTSLIAGSSSFDLLNTTATTINFASAATTLNITGASASTITLGNTTSSTALALKGGSGGTTITNATTAPTTFSSTTSGADSIAIKPQSTGTGAAFTATITTADLTVGAQTFTIPDAAGANDTFCLATLANCTGAGGGSGVTYTGQTNNYLTRFTTTSGQITKTSLLDDTSGNLTLDANNSLTFASGTGVLTQTFTGTSTTAHTITANSLTSGNIVNLTSTSTAAASNTQTGLNIALSGTNSTSAQTTYGIQVSNTHAGTTSTDVAGLFTASGGTTANYGVQITNGDLRVENTGKIPLSAWTSNTNQLAVGGSGVGRRWASSVVANGYLYVIGGFDGTNAQSSVFVGKLQNDGSVGSFATTVALPLKRDEHSTIAYNGYVYVIAGSNDGGTTVVSTTYFAKLGSDGNITGTWQTTNYFPVGRRGTSASTANGYVYVVGGADAGTTVFSTIYQAKLNPDGTVGNWNTSATFLPGVNPRWQASTLTANGYLYVIGGANNTSGTAQSNVYYAALNQDGTLGAFTTNTNLLPAITAAGRFGSSVSLAGGYIYVMGGFDGTNDNSTVFYGKVNNDGSVGSFATTIFLPAARRNATSVIANGYIYTVGGLAGAGYNSTVYYAALARESLAGDLDLLGLNNANIGNSTGDSSVGSAGGNIYAGNEFLAGSLEVSGNAQFWNGLSVNGPTTHYATNGASALSVNSDGQTGAWVQPTAFFPVARFGASSVVANGYVYVIGGHDGTAQRTSVYFAQLNSDGAPGTWNTTINSLPEARFQATSVAANGYIYVIGGSSGTNRSTVYYAKVNSDGTVGPWITNTNSLVNKNRQLSSATANGYIYIIGGSDDNGTVTPLSTVYYAKLNSDGSVGNFTQSTKILPLSRASAYTFTANGYLYVIGGTETSGTVRTSVYYAALNSTDGSLGTFTTNSNSLPLGVASGGISVANGYVYVVAGGTDNAGSARSSIYFAKLNNDGSVGVFNTTIYSLPLARAMVSSVTANGYIYALVGSNDYATTAVSTIYYASLPRVSISGDLDLLGLNNANIGNSTGDSSKGSIGGNIYAGNEFLAGSLEVNGNAQFWNGMSVNGPATHYVTNGATTALSVNSDGQTSNWTQNSTFLAVARSYGQSVVANGYIYVVGGSNDAITSFFSTVYYAKLNNDGSVGTFNTTINAIPIKTAEHSSIAYNGYLYVIGGTNGGDQSGVYYARFNADGSTGSFQSTSYLPVALRLHSTAVANGYVYAIGGTSSARSSVYYAKLQSDGSVGAWNTTVYIPDKRFGSQSIVANGYLYVIGGSDGSADRTNVWYASLNTDGTVTSWSSATNMLPVTLVHTSTPIISNGYLYVTGLGTSGNINSTIYFSKLNNTGDTGVFNTTLYALPSPRRNQMSVVANGYIYMIGGENVSGTAHSTIFYASLPRVSINGDLDLLGLGNANLANSTGDASTGSLGGNIYAGNANLAGALGVSGNTQLWNGLSVTGGANSYVTNGTTTALSVSSDGQNGAWQQNTTNLPVARGLHRTMVANGYIYVIGGTSGTIASSVYVAKLNNDGSVGSFNTTSFALPAAPASGREYSASVIYNGYMYVVGGYDGSVRSSVFYSKINSDGNITAFTATTSLPAASYIHSSVTANGYIYAIGGHNGGAAQSTVLYAKINSDGTIGSWATNTAYLAVARSEHASVVANGYVYVIGGSGTGTTVTYGKLNSDGSITSWAATTSLPAARQQLGTVVSNGYLYVIGGATSTNSNGTSTVYLAKINGDGTLGSFNTTVYAIPVARGYTGGTIANGYMYVIGGSSDGGTANFSTIFYAPLARTSISGDLDLLGLNSGNLGDSTGDSSTGSSGSSIYAGNEFLAGSLEVNGNSQFWNGIGVQGLGTFGTSTDNMALSVINSSTTVTGTVATNLNVAGAMIQSTDLDTISLLVRNTNSGTITMTNVGTAGAQGDPGVLTIEGAGGTTTVYNLITAYNSLTRSDAAAVFRVQADGNVYGEAAFNASGADYAEYFATRDPSLEAGDLVVADSPEASESAIARSTTSYDRKLMGIISTKPGFIGNNDNGKYENNSSFKLVAIAGRAPVKVSTENGPIEVGDYLTSSSLPGIAMKATHPGQVIGKALESYSDEGLGKITVFVNVSFADPQNIFANLILDEQGNLVVPKLKTGQLTLGPIDNVEGETPDLGEIDLIVSFVNPSPLDVASKLHTIDDSIATQSAQLANVKDDTEGLRLRIQNLEASVSGSLANSLNLTPPESLLSSSSATLTNIKITDTLSSEKLISALDVNISGLLKVFGEAILPKTTIAGDLNIDGTFSITEGSTINSLPTLFLQTSVLAEKIDLFNGKVIIDKLGNIVAQATISAPALKTNKLTITNTPIASSSATLGASIGKGTIAANVDKVTIHTTSVSTNSKVFITPTKATDKVLFVTNIIDGTSFDVSVLNSSITDITFDWWIVDN